MNYNIIDNEQYKSKEVYFNGIPCKEIRDALKGMKFRWNNKKGCWYGFATNAEIDNACQGAEVVEIPNFEKVEEGTIYEGWKGGKAGTWHDDKELKALIMADLKKAGIKATIRFHNAGYLTSFTLTITLGKDAVKTFEEWEKGYNFFNAPFGWVQYMENGTRRDIHREALLTMENEQPEEFKRIIESNKAIRYQDAINNLSSSNCYFGNGLDILTSEGNAILTAAKSIVDAYNHDQTNSQIDYFDRDIYDHYAIKIA